MHVSLSDTEITHLQIVYPPPPPSPLPYSNIYTLDRGSSPLLAQTASQTHANHPSLLATSIYTCSNYSWLLFFSLLLFFQSLDENFLNANHFDVTRSKYRQTKPIVWATQLILMSRHADRQSSLLFLADLPSMQCGC